MKKQPFIFIKTDKKFVKLFYADIGVIKGLGNYVTIQTIRNRKYVYYKSLKELIENLPDEFMRIHNSYIVNLANIDFVEGNQVSLKGLKITVAKSYRECLKAALDKYLL